MLLVVVVVWLLLETVSSCCGALVIGVLIKSLVDLADAVLWKGGDCRLEQAVARDELLEDDKEGDSGVSATR